VILDERFATEPCTPVIRRGDENWHDIVRWFVHALVQAEGSGITAAHAKEQRRTSQDASTRRLLGAVPEVGQALKLDPAWALNAIRTIGNHGELYDRHFGPSTLIVIPRGQNRLWTQGRLMYALAMRSRGALKGGALEGGR